MYQAQQSMMHIDRNRDGQANKIELFNAFKVMLQQQAQQQQQMYQQQKGYGQQGNSQPGYGTQAYGTQYVATGNQNNKQQGWGSAYGNFKPF